MWQLHVRCVETSRNIDFYFIEMKHKYIWKKNMRTRGLMKLFFFVHDLYYKSDRLSIREISVIYTGCNFFFCYL